MRGANQIRIAVAEYPLLFHNCSLTNLAKRQSCKEPGMGAEILLHLLQYLQLDYELRLFEPSSSCGWGRLVNGSSTISDTGFNPLPPSGHLCMLHGAASLTHSNLRFICIQGLVYLSFINFLSLHGG